MLHRTEGRDPVDDIYKINAELEAYNPEIADRPQVIAANKIDADLYSEDEDPVARSEGRNLSQREFRVFPISACNRRRYFRSFYIMYRRTAEALDDSTDCI